MKKLSFYKLGLLILVFQWCLVLHGQISDSIFLLESIEVVASKEKYLIGSKTETMDSLILSTVSSGSLTDIINSYLPIHIKQHAGSFATVSFRGTSPDHTAIMFNGVNINSLTLGHSNVSDIPAFLFDEVKVQYGGSGSLYGSDAIGGSIQLNNHPVWDNGVHVALHQDISSFGGNFSGIKTGFSNKKFQYSIKAYKRKKENNFPFLNTAVKNFEKDEFVRDTSKNTAILNYGILQEIYYNVSNKLFTYIKLWYDDDWHQIQPNMSTNYYGGTFTEILNKHLRLISGFKYYTGAHKLTTDIGYVYDYQLYNKNVDEIISTNSIITNINYFNSKVWKGEMNIGIDFKHIKPDVYAYQDNLTEDRFELYAAYKRKIVQRLEASVILRETFVTDYKNQFAPSLGLNYSLIKNEKNDLNLKLAYSHSFKIPTFNDRYWANLGNPELLPETGVNYEFNTDYSFTGISNKCKIGVSVFYMEVDNWIQWVNMGVWRPRNIKKVQNKGVEFSLESQHKLSIIKIQTGFNYSYIRAVNAASYQGNDNTQGKQLIYTPEHIANARLRLSYNTWNLQTTASYTGNVFTESFKILPGYFLFNARTGKNFKFKKHVFSVNFGINNILNKAYQSMEWYAMPGRNYTISIKYFINSIKFIKNEND